jgi:hypothetical protein
MTDKPIPPQQAADTEGALLSELDALVAGSHWGNAPLLSRDQANDRALMRKCSSTTYEGANPEVKRKK